jgi:hypothetical protein
MKDKLEFVRLPILLFVFFFVAKLIMGAVAGVNTSTYRESNQFFSMVILQVHVGLLWGAVGRRYRGYAIGGSVLAVLLAVFASQILIFTGTAVSYLAGLNTFFNFGEALNQPGHEVPFAAAMVARTVTLIANCIAGMIFGGIGWLLGGLLPPSSTSAPSIR